MKKRTYKEIVVKGRELLVEFIGSFTIDDLVGYLPYKYAKEFIKKETTSDEWEMYKREYKIKNVIQDMADYMKIAWETVVEGNASPVATMMEHYQNWFWLIGDDVMTAMCKEYDFNSCGRSTLIKICKFLGIDHTEFDDRCKKMEEENEK